MLKWREYNGVPMDESTKMQWIEEMIERINNGEAPNPTFTQCGDTRIVVEKEDWGTFTVSEFRPVRTAYDVSPATLDDSLNSGLSTVEEDYE